MVLGSVTVTNPPFPPQQPGDPQQPAGPPQQPAGYPQQPAGYPQQPGGYPQPGAAPYPPQQPPKKSRTTRTVLIIVAAVLAFCCLGAGTVGFLIYKGVDNATGPVVDGAGAYLDDLRDGDYQGAYAKLCRVQQIAVTESAFVANKQRQPKIVDYEINGRRVSTNNGVRSGSVDITVTFDNGAKNSETLQMSHESGEWRVCS